MSSDLKSASSRLSWTSNANSEQEVSRCWLPSPKRNHCGDTFSHFDRTIKCSCLGTLAPVSHLRTACDDTPLPTVRSLNCRATAEAVGGQFNLLRAKWRRTRKALRSIEVLFASINIFDSLCVTYPPGHAAPNHDWLGNFAFLLIIQTFSISCVLIALSQRGGQREQDGPTWNVAPTVTTADVHSARCPSPDGGRLPLELPDI